MKSKIPVTISITIHQAPATYFVSLLWLMWFCAGAQIRGGGGGHVPPPPPPSLFEGRLNGLSPLFKCPYMFDCLLFVCLCTCLFESMLMFTLECTTTKETLKNTFISTEKN